MFSKDDSDEIEEGDYRWLEAQVKRFCPQITPEEWEEIEPDWHEPYSEADVHEIMGRWVKLRGGTTPTRRRRERKPSKVDTSLPQVSPKTIWLHMRDRYEDWRRHFGFSAPVKVEELRGALINLGATPDKDAVRGDGVFDWDFRAFELSYTSAVKPLAPLVILYELESLYFSIHNHDLYFLMEYADLISNTHHCHLALALSVLLCDMPLYDGIAIIFEKQTLKLEVASVYAIQPKTLAKAYSLGQREILNPASGQRRRRTESIKTWLLWAYRQATPELTWQERWARWNSRSPEWRYDNAQSMVSAYTRARKTQEANNEYLRQLEKKLGVTSIEINETKKALEKVQR
jgi:hypothetical protein